MSIRTIYIGICLLPSLLFGGQQALAKKRMLDDLDFLQHTFEVKYAPLEWKKNHLGVDLFQEFDLARQYVQQRSKITTKEFQHLVHKIFNSAGDYHVGVKFYSTESATLPFIVKSAIDPLSDPNRRYFIVDIERNGIAYSAFPFNVGDELIAWDDQPIDQVVQALCKQEFGDKNSYQTNLALTEELLTHRSGSAGNVVPSGSVKLTIKPLGAQCSQNVVLRWDYRQERIKDFASLDPSKNRNNIGPHLKVHSNEKVKSYQPTQGMMVAAHFCPKRPQMHEDNPYEEGNRSSYIPALGPKIWSSQQDDYYDAYIFPSPSGHLIGYIRIPHYMADEEEVLEFCTLMRLFEHTTDALVIDQIDNPGGSIFYLYGLVSALATSPIEVPKHHISLTQDEIASALNILPDLEDVSSIQDAQEVLGHSLGGLPITMEFVEGMKTFYRKIVQEWEEGKLYTDPVYVFGVDKLTAHPDGCYTKPVLVLINHLDFSGGDFFPAILQDSGRATILGTRTAGAGGYVIATEYPNYNGIASFNLTGSLAERMNKEPIENLGVNPDIEYALQIDDLRYNYREYVNKILSTIDSMAS